MFPSDDRVRPYPPAIPPAIRLTRRLVILSLILIVLGFGRLALADSIPLSGQLQIGANVDKHGLAQAGDSRFHFLITGAAAKVMFESLSGDVIKDDCSGFIRKSEGNVNCYAKTIQQAYSCNFAINIQQSRLESSAPTCQ
jgi:hypothetical protein